MMTNQNVTLCAGDTPTIAIALDVAAPPAFSPAGAVATWTLYSTASAPVAGLPLTKSTADVCTFNQDDTGLYWLWVPLLEADTSGLAAGTYFHTARVVEAGGGRFHVMTGKFTVSAVPDP